MSASQAKMWSAKDLTANTDCPLAYLPRSKPVPADGWDIKVPYPAIEARLRQIQIEAYRAFFTSSKGRGEELAAKLRGGR